MYIVTMYLKNTLRHRTNMTETIMETYIMVDKGTDYKSAFEKCTWIGHTILRRKHDII